jgi:hypothetical protein
LPGLADLRQRLLDLIRILQAQFAALWRRRPFSLPSGSWRFAECLV